MQVRYSAKVSSRNALVITRDHRCLDAAGAAIGLRIASNGPVTFSLGSSDTALLPESRMQLTGLGDGDRELRLELRPIVAAAPGVARVTITSTNVAGSVNTVARVVVGDNGPDRLRGSGLTDVLLGRGGTTPPTAAEGGTCSVAGRVTTSSAAVRTPT